MVGSGGKISEFESLLFHTEKLLNTKKDEKQDEDYL